MSEPTDHQQMVMFINKQFHRLGMFYDSEKGMRNHFISQLNTHTKWRVLMNVVNYINQKCDAYYGWSDW
jgi:hypothetical protein